MAAQPPSKELEQSEQAPASLPQADQVPAKRKATEELQHSRRPPTQPGTLPFIWNLPTTPSLPIFYADATLVPSDDEYDSEDELELESDEVVDELAKTKQQLYEAKKKIAALAKRLRMYQVTVLPMDYKLVDEPVKEPVKEKSAIEREADALRVFSLKQWEEHLKSEDEKGNEYDKIEDYRAVFEDVEWAVHEHHRLVHLALGELRKGRTGPAGSIDDYKPGQLPMYILDKSQCSVSCDVESLKRLFECILKKAGIVYSVEFSSYLVVWPSAFRQRICSSTITHAVHTALRNDRRFIFFTGTGGNKGSMLQLSSGQGTVRIRKVLVSYQCFSTRSFVILARTISVCVALQSVSFLPSS
ncbi:hypothetical protein SMAC4_06107 [Sordaria macrospora]|nr:hypothetical protein SMAC4_06107 [Sordaria macrospora]